MTVLLVHLRSRGGRCPVVRISGIQAELELAFAGLHQLCLLYFDQLDQLPPHNEPGSVSAATGFRDIPQLIGYWWAQCY